MLQISIDYAKNWKNERPKYLNPMFNNDADLWCPETWLTSLWDVESNVGRPAEPRRKRSFWTEVAVGAAVGGAAMVCAPAAVGILGFTSGRIAAGSWGATMMSWGAGTTPYVVSVMQSVGAAGISGSTAAAAGAVAAAVTGVVKKAVEK